ncbi:MAG TPA: SDR family oxidoreductase [Phycisphaerae bacterium]|nr:SDR family oxidoreductase [Phycisphaerae bacterium]HOM51031.1 SDR family oxidoreductase [Phycisphaerae bacterium]HON65892.1 SDR family oxidoreductase [Phycisphaerae bacterium]HOQ85194.1 SDR family oxidoreductase [Phycisphaerae bacterium]HPP25740.1 SDR family oxidoreductase [Phycisphaerae bacterium]
MSSQHCILLTGATGLIGGELLPLLLSEPGNKVWALVRPDGISDADSRLAARVQRGNTSGLEIAWDRLTGVAGDLTVDHLGMAPDDRRAVASSVDTILHCAAETSFIRDEGCRRINVDGMAHLIEFARSCRKPPRFVYISTATVCGAVRDMHVTEDDARDGGPDHHNEYTRTKALAERMLRESGLDYLILRPSITISAGMSDRVFASAIMWFLPLLNRLDAIPIDPAGRLDVVTVAYVAQAIVAALNAENRRHDCYHISAGRESLTLGRAARFLDAYYGRSEPLELVPAHLWTRDMHRQYVRTPEQRKTFATLKHYLPFLNMNVTYDNGRLRELLGDAMPRLEPFESYAGDLLEIISPELLPRG